MIDKLSPSQERGIIQGIEKAIAYTRTGMHPDAALAKVARESGFNPEITKRACEAFNKSKTVYMLTNRKSDTRAENFDHANPDKVVQDVFVNAEKTAELKIPVSDFSSMGLEQAFAPFTKAAASAEAGGIKTDIEYKRDLLARMDYLDKFDRQTSAVGMCKAALEMAVEDTLMAMRYMNQTELQKVAHVVMNRYGNRGASFLKILEAGLGKELPLQKTANYAVLPLCPPYPSIDKAMQQASNFVEEKAKLQKLAEEAPHFFV